MSALGKPSMVSTTPTPSGMLISVPFGWWSSDPGPSADQFDRSRRRRRLKDPFELELGVPHPSVEEPVPAEHPVIVGGAGDMGPRPAGRAGHEPDPLEPVLQARPREGGGPEQALGQHP